MIINSGPLTCQDLPTPIPGSLTADTVRLTSDDYGDFLLSESVFAPFARESVYEREVNEIALARLTAGDQLIIETAHSVYLFTLTDPNNDTGNLIGGLIGNYATKACLLSLSTDSELPLRGCKSIRTGARAHFLIEAESTTRCLLTSTITRLVYRKTKGT